MREGVPVASVSESRIDALLARMTLPEKLGQLTMVSADFAVTGPTVSDNYVSEILAGAAGSILNLYGGEATRGMQRLAVEQTRLGIPLLMTFDVVHGHRTIFPVPLGEAAAFDPDLWERTARAAAIEASADGLALTFAPMLDVCRDPRWGRIVEGPGEDPWLASRFAEAKVRGFQGPDLTAEDSVAAQAKHFTAYGAPLAGRDYAQVDVSERMLHETYLPPFAAAVAAGVPAIMPAFNDIAGVPMTANRPLLTELVRERWGFDGAMISDYGAIGELIQHGIAADLAEAAALALRAGVDIDMMSGAYARGLPVALERGLVDMADIDAAVRRVLALKERLGLFDDPYRRGAVPLPEGWRVAYRGLAREAACRSMVLLTNRDAVLPVADSVRRIAVIGPLAHARRDMLGSWYGAGNHDAAITFLDGLRIAMADRDLTYEAGLPLIPGDAPDDDRIAEAVAAARGADLVLLCIGETASLSGEAASRGRLELPDRQEELARAVLAAGTPVVVALVSGRPLPLPWLFEQAAAVIATWFPGDEAGNALADILTGAWNPTGRLPVSWPTDGGQIPIFHARRPTGRPAHPDNHYTSKYLDLPVEPQFPFGHGLSYAQFVYSDLQVSPPVFRAGDTLAVEVEVGNVGPVAGEETVLLFVRDSVASIARPIMELKGLARAVLEPGEARRVRIMLPVAELALVGPDMEPVLEPGEFRFFVGPAADPARLLEATVQLA
ncbi:beta-glucosidase [Constrictibacter sp. MBR-5]|jgi:beta-glucosidase